MILGTLVPDGILLRSSTPGFAEPIYCSPGFGRKVEAFVQRRSILQPGQLRCCAECVKQPRPVLGLGFSAWRGAPSSKGWRVCDRPGVVMQSEQLHGVSLQSGTQISF